MAVGPTEDGNATTPASSEAAPSTDAAAKRLPRGIVLGPDGKPCRTCSSFASWAALTKKQTAPAADGRTAPLVRPRADCPPDVDELGRSTWTLLHTMAAQYPERPTRGQQSDAAGFMRAFANLYPCWSCAGDFQAWMKAGNAPRVSSREDFGRWLCEAHNEVNSKLGKPSFDCNRWQERWRAGWKDGSCD